jgi:hypothetical protein
MLEHPPVRLVVTGLLAPPLRSGICTSGPDGPDCTAPKAIVAADGVLVPALLN